MWYYESAFWFPFIVAVLLLPAFFTIDSGISRVAANFDVGLVHMPLRGHSALAQIESLQQDGRMSNNPMMNRRVIDADAPLGHYFFEV